jgi:serine/threonine protein kinase
MGFVFEVEHAATFDRLALKVMRTHSTPLPGVVDRFKREARTAARIKSEHVVRVIDADVSEELGGVLYIVMELLEGTDLDRACEGPQAPVLVVEWLRQVGHGLDKAHALGIVHRDLKPENLFLTSGDHGEPRVKILDFGVAKTHEDAPGTTQTGQLLGTPLFMSPEHARASGDIGPAADRYALGLVAYRLLAGVDYWLPSANVAGIITQILYDPMEAPSARGLDLGAEFDAWFARACHRDPAQRFATSLDLVQELARALHVELGGPVDRSSLALSPRGRWDATTLHSRPETTMAPTLQSASNPSPEPHRSHRGRYIVGAFVALSALFLWAGFMITQTRTEKSALDESPEPRAAAVAPPLPRAPAPSVPAEPEKAARSDATSAPPAASRAPSNAAPAHTSSEQSTATKKVVASDGTATERTLTRAPPFPARGAPAQSNKKKSKPVDDPLADQK